MAETTLEPPKKPRRTRKTAAPEPAKPARPEGIHPFPAIQKARSKEGTIPPEELFRYWGALKPEFQERCIVYVNREWPVMNYLQLLTPEAQDEVRMKRRRYPPKYISKHAAPWETTDWRAEILRRHGSGDYKIYLNDAGVAGFKRDPELGSHNICRALVQIRDDEFAPVIEDLRALDLTDPRNTSFIQALRLKGVTIPGLAEEVEDVANNEALKSMASKVEQLADKVATSENEKMVERLERTIKETAGARVTAVDPIDTATKIIQLTQGDGAQKSMMEMFGRQLERAQDRADELERELRTRNNPAPTTPVNPLDAMLQAGEGYKKLREMFGGSPKETETAVAAAVRSRMGPWMEFFQPVLPEVAGIVKAFAQPLAHVMAQKMMQQKSATPQQTTPSVTPPPPGIPAPSTNGTATQTQAEPPVPQNAEEQNLLDFINAITPRMLNHLQQGIDGGSFAAWVADGYSLDRVQQMQLAPPSAIVDFYKATPFWPQLVDREASFVKFLEEFNAWKPDEPDETPSDGEDEQEEVG